MSPPLPDGKKPKSFSYDDAVDEIARQYGVPKAVYLPLKGQESGDKDHVVSPKNAQTAWQIMPGTAKQLGYTMEQLHADPLKAAEAGLRYLRDNYKSVRPYAQNDKHGWMAATAAYHAGPGAVLKDFKNGGLGLPNTSDGLITTRNYVMNIFRKVGPQDIDRTPDRVSRATGVSLPTPGYSADLEPVEFTGGAPTPLQKATPENVQALYGQGMTWAGRDPLAWLKGTTPPVTQLPEDVVAQATYEQIRLNNGLEDTEELRAGFMTRWNAMKAGKASRVLTIDEDKYLTARKVPTQLHAATDLAVEKQTGTPQPQKLTLGQGAYTQSDDQAGVADGFIRVTDKDGRTFLAKKDATKAPDASGAVSWSLKQEIPDWAKGTTKPVSKLPDNKVLQESYEIYLRDYRLPDSEELRQKFITGYAKIQKGEATEIFDAKERRFLQDVAEEIANHPEKYEQKKVSRVVRKKAPVPTREVTAQPFEQTGTITTASGQKYRYSTDRTGLQENEYRFVDENGETFIGDKDSGNIRDESLAQKAFETQIELLPGNLRSSTSPEVAKRALAGQLGAKMKGAAGVPQSDIRSFYEGTGFRKLSTGEDFSPEDYFAKGESVAEPFSVTRREMQGLQEYSKGRRKLLEDWVLNVMASGRKLTDSERQQLKDNDVDLDEIRSRRYDDFEMAKTKGDVAKQDFSRYLAKYQEEEGSEYLGRLRAEEKMGWIPKGTATTRKELVARARERAEQTVAEQRSMGRDFEGALDNYRNRPQDVEDRIQAEAERTVKEFDALNAKTRQILAKPELDGYDVNTDPRRFLPYVSSLVEMKGMFRLLDAANRVKTKTADQFDLALLRNFNAQESKPKTFWYQVFDTMAQAPSFIGEMGLTGGAYTLAKKGLKTGAFGLLKKVVTDEGIKVLEKEATRSLLKIGGKTAVRAARKAGEFGVEAAATLGASVPQTLAAAPFRIATDTARYAMPQVQVAEKDTGELQGIVTKEGDDFPTALKRAALGQFGEVFSEHSGGALSFIPVPKRLEAIKAGIIKWWMGAERGRTVSGFKQFLDKAGWHGVVGEMFEERVAGAYDYARGEAPSPLPTLEQLAVEGVSFGAMGTVFQGAQKALNRRAEAGGLVVADKDSEIKIFGKPIKYTEDTAPFIDKYRETKQKITKAQAKIDTLEQGDKPALERIKAEEEKIDALQLEQVDAVRNIIDRSGVEAPEDFDANDAEQIIAPRARRFEERLPDLGQPKTKKSATDTPAGIGNEIANTPTPQRRQGQVSDDFYIRVGDDFKRVDGTPIELPGYEEGDFFTYIDGDKITISEGSTGRKMSEAKRTKTAKNWDNATRKATTAALEVLGKRKNALAEIQMVRRGTKTAPRYADVEQRGKANPKFQPSKNDPAKLKKGEWFRKGRFEYEVDSIKNGRVTAHRIDYPEGKIDLTVDEIADEYNPREAGFASDYTYEPLPEWRKDKKLFKPNGLYIGPKEEFVYDGPKSKKIKASFAVAQIPTGEWVDEVSYQDGRSGFTGGSHAMFAGNERTRYATREEAVTAATKNIRTQFADEPAVQKWLDAIAPSAKTESTSTSEFQPTARQTAIGQKLLDLHRSMNDAIDAEQKAMDAGQDTTAFTNVADAARAKFKKSFGKATVGEQLAFEKMRAEPKSAEEKPPVEEKPAETQPAEDEKAVTKESVGEIEKIVGGPYSTPGTRLKWHDVKEWLDGLDKLSKRQTSSEDQAKAAAHWQALAGPDGAAIIAKAGENILVTLRRAVDEGRSGFGRQARVGGTREQDRQTLAPIYDYISKRENEFGKAAANNVVKEVSVDLAMPWIEADTPKNKKALDRRVEVVFEAPSGRSTTRKVLVSERQEQIRKKHAAIEKLWKCMNG